MGAKKITFWEIIAKCQDHDHLGSPKLHLLWGILPFGFGKSPVVISRAEEIIRGIGRCGTLG